MPDKIAAAIKSGEYKTWKISLDKEGIFKDSEKDELKAFKIGVVKGNQKHHLFYSADGELLKDKSMR